MSLNKFTDLQTGKDLKLDIGCRNLSADNIVSATGGVVSGHFVLARNRLEYLTGDTKLVNLTTPDRGLPNYSLHTDGAGACFWSPDDTGSGDITYNGTLPSVVGKHLKTSNLDGTTAEDSKLLEDATNLDMGGLNITNVGSVDGENVSSLGTQVGTNTTDIGNLQTGKLSIDGSLAMTGDLDMNSNNISNVVNINGSSYPPAVASDPNKLSIDGTIAMTGNLNMGGSNITNVNLVDGEDISALATQVGTNTTNIGNNASAILNKLDKDGSDDLRITKATSLITLKDSVSMGASNGELRFTDSLNADICKIAGTGGNMILSRGGAPKLELKASENTMNQNLNMNSNSITNVNLVDGEDISALATAIGTNTTNNSGTVTIHSDVSNAGSGLIITAGERTAIGTNTTNNSGTVTIHSDVSNAGSGLIITAGERTAIGTNTTNNSGTVTIHSDVSSAGSGSIITAGERTAIGTNTTNNTGPVTIHSDVSSAGSGQIITSLERTAIGTNTTNNTGTVTIHSDVSSAGSGSIITGIERTAIGTNTTNNSGTVTIHSDVSNAGSGLIITAGERTAIGTNTTNNSGTVTIHSDVSNAGSGLIITAGERTAIGTNTTNNTGPVTVHSDVSSAGSGQIITSLERTAIGTNTSDIATKVSKAGDTMTGDLVMSSNLINDLSNPIEAYDATNKYSVATSTQSAQVNLSSFTLRTTPGSNHWEDITYSPELQLFCAVTYAGLISERVMTSPNGEDWTFRTVPELNVWNGVAWSPSLSLFAAVSNSGTNRVMTSSDGITWVSQSAPSEFWTSITWSEQLQLFCAVSSSGIPNKSMVSANGTSWTSYNMSSTTSVTDVTSAEELGLFVACSSSSGTIMYSQDGQTWSSVASGVVSGWTGITWSPELRLLACSASSGTDRIMYSHNAINWTGVTVPLNTFRDIEWCGPGLEMFIACSADSKAIYSTDAVNWTTDTVPGALSWQCAAYSPELLRVVFAGTAGDVASADYILRTNRLQADLINDLPIISSKYVGTSSLTIFNTTTPTSMVPTGVGSLVIPPNSSNAGDMYKFYACGNIDTDGNKDFDINLDLGGVNIATAPVLNTDMDGSFFEVIISVSIRTIGATASVIGCGVAKGVKGTNLLAKIVNGSGSIDTTASNTFTMEFTWGEASMNRTVTFTTFLVTYIRGNFD